MRDVMTSFRRLGHVSLLLGTALGSGTAFAQAASNADTGTEIVVTAQKRSQNVQSIPATISVVSPEQLSQFHATQLTDIGAYVPGLQVDSSGTPGQTQLSIRGIAPIGSAATVATYIDDTPVGASSFHERGGVYSLDLLPYDVQRIEVLEGPQGTLYGANALGGLVRYVLTQPNLTRRDIRFGGDLEGISGAHNPGGGARAMINTPLIDGKLGFIASASLEDTPGFIDNIQTGQKDQNHVRQESARLALLWQANPDLSVKLGFLYQHTNADGNASVELDPTTLKPLTPKQTDNNYVPNLFRSKIFYYTGDIDYDLHFAKLVSATSFSKTSSDIQQEATRTYAPIIDEIGIPGARTPFTLDLGNKKFTQELRLSSPSGGKLEWLVGAYYDHEKSSNVQVVNSLAEDGTSIAGLDPLFVGRLPSTYRELAVFGDATYRFTHWFDLSAGIRYANNKQTFTEIIDPGSPILPAASTPGSSSEGVVTYSVSPRFHLTDKIMAYGRVASGYQPGGPNTALPGVPPAVNSSRLMNYEVGIKSSFWDNRAILNVSAFDLEWSKIQVAGTSPGGITYTTNGGTARSRGVQVDGSLRPIRGLTLAATATYTDAIFTQDVPSVGASDGDMLPFTPKWSGSVRASYDWALGGDWTGHVGGGVRLVGDRFSLGPVLVNQYRTPGYTSVDLNANVSSGRYTIGVFVKNLTNKRAYLTETAVQNGLTGDVAQVMATILQPTTAGITFDVKF